MKKFQKIFLAALITFLVLFMSSCFDNKSDSTDTNEETTSQNISAPETEGDGKPKSSKPAKTLTDEEKAVKIINSYVNAAKKLDFDEMSKYISDNNSLPILDSYTDAYARYSVSDERIQELCKARLSTYQITPLSVSKNGNSFVVKTNISMVNMDSLENRWMEVLCDRYPEYTSLSSDEMTPEVVDVLIQTMIDVLKEAETSIEVQKDFVLQKNESSWIINAKNEDFFPSN